MPMPQALTSFSPIIARTFITILFTFFIISLSFLSMFYNTKLRAFVFCCILMRSKYTLKGQILDTGQEFAPFYEKKFQKPNLRNSFSKLGVKISFPILALISSNVQKRPPASSSLGVMGPS